MSSGANDGNDKKPAIIATRYTDILINTERENIFLILLSTGLFNSAKTGKTMT